jgi:hypothetical protein
MFAYARTARSEGESHWNSVNHRYVRLLCIDLETSVGSHGRIRTDMDYV